MQWLRKLWWRISDWAAATDFDFADGEEGDDPYYDGYFVRATGKNAVNNDLPGREYWYSL